MEAYYIYQNGIEEGPFSLDDLRGKQITRNTMLRHSRAEGWHPAYKIDALKDLITDNQEGSKGSKARHFPRGNMRLLIGIAILVAAVLAGAFYFAGKRENVPPKEEIKAIHEREVQKAIQELQQEKIAGKRSEAERQELLDKRKAELQALNGQLKKLLSERSFAYEEMQDIERPRLFRSRRKKETQLAEQQRIVRSLDSRIESLRARIDKCRKDIEELSPPEKP